MKKVILGLLIGIVAVSGCIKKNDVTNPTYDPCALKATTAEITAVEKFLTDSSVIANATKQCGGMYYEIKNPGTGATPTLYSYLTVSYRGSYVKPGATSSVFFEETANGPVAFNQPLISLIDGWKKGLPLIKKGGSITLYIPPSLGYGPADSGPIPANSILIFSIQLVDVQ